MKECNSVKSVATFSKYNITPTKYNIQIIIYMDIP